MSLKTSWAYNNFTYLSYQKDLRIHYLLWIMIISCFLLYKINKLFKKITYLSPLNKTLIIFSFLSVIIGSFLPYHPDNENIPIRKQAIALYFSSIIELFYQIRN